MDATFIRASIPVRVLYALALLAPFPAMLALASGWVGLATGGGLAAVLGMGVPAILALVLFRAWQALWYPRTLDARLSTLGSVLRALGVLLMLVAVLCAAGLFFVKPLTLAILGTAGDAGIGYFMMTLALGSGGHLGFAGCALFEVGRAIGPPMDDAERGPPPSRRVQVGVFASLLVMLVAIPLALREFGPQLGIAVDNPPCGERDLAACVSTTSGGVKRMIALEPGAPVALETNIEEIELRRRVGGETRWSLIESPRISLRTAGHPVVSAGEAEVRFKLEAAKDGEVVRMTLSVHHGAEQTAGFVTRFEKNARIEADAAGTSRVVVDLPGGEESGMRAVFHSDGERRGYMLDHFYMLARQAVGNAVEAREAAVLLRLESFPASPGALHGPRELRPWMVDPNCAGRVSVDRGKLKAPSVVGETYDDITFAASPLPPPHSHTVRGRIVCRGDEIWVIDEVLTRPTIRMRRFSPDGTPLRYVETTLPPAAKGADDFAIMDAESFFEEPGKLRFARQIFDSSGVRRREFFEVSVP